MLLPQRRFSASLYMRSLALKTNIRSRYEKREEWYTPIYLNEIYHMQTSWQLINTRTNFTRRQRMSLFTQIVILFKDDELIARPHGRVKATPKPYSWCLKPCCMECKTVYQLYALLTLQNITTNHRVHVPLLSHGLDQDLRICPLPKVTEVSRI